MLQLLYTLMMNQSLKRLLDEILVLDHLSVAEADDSVCFSTRVLVTSLLMDRTSPPHLCN